MIYKEWVLRVNALKVRSRKCQQDKDLDCCRAKNHNIKIKATVSIKRISWTTEEVRCDGDKNLLD